MPGTVLVGCKMPNGVVLNLDRYEIVIDRDVRRIEGSKTVKLKGNAIAFGTPDITVGGYAFTTVDADFWEAWVKHNVNSSLLADKLIFARPRTPDAEAQAREQSSVAGQFPPGKQDFGSVKTMTAE
jgi:hypothetical protein